MKKLFYSEILRKYYDTEEDCLKAEEEYNEKHKAELVAKAEKTAKAKEVEEAYKKYIELRSAFIKKYGQFHMTLTDKDLPTNSVFDIFDRFWF